MYYEIDQIKFWRMTMARFQSRTLSWKPVDSKDVVGYNVYWAKGATVSYDSESIYVQDLTEIIIPEALKGFVPEAGIYMFGITAVDRWGNESDIKKLIEPLRFSAPLAPASVWLDSVGSPCPPDFFSEVIIDRVAGDRKNEMAQDNADLESRLLRTSEKKTEQPSLKYYDDIGFRKI
jgi:hypothetical protein